MRGRKPDILTGTSNVKLAQDVARILGWRLQQPCSEFANGEIRVKIPYNLRRNEVFIIQSLQPDPNKALMEACLMADAAKRASAEEITLVSPVFAYDRQDQKEQSRVPISVASVVDQLVLNGVDRFLTVDIHTGQSQGLFRGPWDNLLAEYALAPEIRRVLRREGVTKLKVGSVDEGGGKRVARCAEHLDADGVCFVHKRHLKNVANKTEVFAIVGDVAGYVVIVFDDMFDTAGSMCNAIEAYYDAGATEVWVAATHAILSGEAFDRLLNSHAKYIFATDTVAPRMFFDPKVIYVSVAPMLAEALKRIRSGKSLSHMFQAMPDEFVVEEESRETELVLTP